MTFEFANLTPIHDFMHLNHTRPKVSRSGVPAPLPFRHDIEGIRAIAILVIVGFHFKVSWLRGGFVGVDAFFVVSGYLITAMLVAEFDRAGHVDLENFYGKRARRLLPALLLVTIITLACATILLPPPEQMRAARAALASSLYLSNFWFLQQWFDYFAPENANNPFLHTWALSVEVQFYVLWSVLFFVAGRLKLQRSTLAIGIALISFASFIFCLWLTHTKQAWAFYASPTRVWEFGLGGLASFAPVRWFRNSASAIGWCGLLLLLASFALIDGDTVFPGYAALMPAAATACVLMSGAAKSARSPASLLAAEPLQWIGRRSYSIYLWHWPMIVFASILFPSLSGWGRLVCAAFTLGFAALSYRLLEKPLRSNGWLAARTKRSLAMGVTLSAIGAVAAGGVVTFVYRLASSPAQKAISDSALLPSAASSRGCLVAFTDAKAVGCSFGVTSSSRTFVLLGDSHADEWSTPLATLAEREGWHMVTYLKSSCAVAKIPVYNIRLHRISSECASWRSQALDSIVRLGPDAVIIVEYSSGYIHGPQSDSGEHAVDLTTWSAGLEASLRQLRAAGIPVILVRDSPTPATNIRNCLSYADWRGVPESRCATPRSLAVSEAITDAERSVAEAIPGVRFVDFSSIFCDQTTCPAVRDGIIVYRDGDHLTTRYATHLAGPLKDLLLPMMNNDTTAGVAPRL